MNDPRLLKGIAHFNKREFYDAHEVWEELWHELQGQEANFVQGLIQFATALHHFEAYNLKGARILHEGGLELLEGIQPIYWGVAIQKLVQQMKVCMAEVMAYAQKDLPGRYHPDKKSFPVKIKDELVPQIEFKKEDAHA